MREKREANFDNVSMFSPSGWNEPNFRERKPDSLHLRDSPRKRLSRAISVSSGTNPYNTRIKEGLHNISTTSEYNSSAQAGYKSSRTESRKVKHLRSGSIEPKRLQLHRQLEHRTSSSLHTFVIGVVVVDGHKV
jgi:DNA-nicking Smr family endonuclease